jgi:hypothetical protein
MQPVSKQRIDKHAYNNRGIVNGVFFSVRAKWLYRRVQLRIGSRVPELQVISWSRVGLYKGG